MYRLALLLLLAAPFRVSTLTAPRPQADHRHRPPPPSSASPPPPLSLAPQRPPVAPPRAAAASVQRREALRRSGGGLAAAAAAAAGVAAAPPSALAFDNAVAEYAKYADKPKRKGSPPKDVGLASRTVEGEDGPRSFVGLRGCDGKPNCFSTTGDDEIEERLSKGVDNLIGAWRPPADEPAPLKALAAAVRAYPPGQGLIDGGGFRIVEASDRYLYAQFESLKKGFVDDLEFGLGAGSSGGRAEVLVRSASRIGYTDFGVNAIRLNFLAAKLREQGWAIDEITPKTHRDYWTASDEAREATFDADRRRMDGGEGVVDTVKPSNVFNR